MDVFKVFDGAVLNFILEIEKRNSDKQKEQAQQKEQQKEQQKAMISDCLKSLSSMFFVKLGQAIKSEDYKCVMQEASEKETYLRECYKTIAPVVYHYRNDALDEIRTAISYLDCKINTIDKNLYEGNYENLKEHSDDCYYELIFLKQQLQNAGLEALVCIIKYA